MIQNLIIALKITPVFVGIILITISMLIIIYNIIVFSKKTAARIMHEKISDSSLKIIPNAGHVANMENPSEFYYRLTKFADLVSKKLSV